MTVNKKNISLALESFHANEMYDFSQAFDILRNFNVPRTFKNLETNENSGLNTSKKEINFVAK